MEIKSKFNIGDTVYFMDYEIPRKAIICEINTYTVKEITHVTYSFNKGISKIVNENDIYTTKEELQKSMLSLVEERFEILS